MINIEEHITLSKEERQKHLNLDEPCCIRGGNSTHHKGVLALFLDTTIPKGRILLCHACNNRECSNPHHLYWGTDLENIEDASKAGTRLTVWQKTVNKYGLAEARKVFARKNNKNACKKPT